MPKASLRLLWSFLVLILPSPTAGQVSVVSPGAGTASSYRNTTLRWLPIPGATTYHLEVDDDPAFRSPEVDVVVDRPSYTLKGETLRLNGQLAWAAYVRVNGMRWQREVFSPSYFLGGFWPEVAVDSGGKVYYGYLRRNVDDRAHALMRTSDDFSAAVRLSPPDTAGNPHDLAVEVGASGVAHAFWTEQRGGFNGVPFHAKSPDWSPSQVGDPVGGAFDVGASMILLGGRVEVFEEGFGSVQWFTSPDGQTFTKSEVPNSSPSVTVHATLDPPGDILLVEERIPGRQLVLQRSRNNWVPEPIGTGRFPSAAVGADGVIHVVARDGLSGEVSYSNSTRAFATWTPMPMPAVIGQQLLPIVVDNQRQLVHMAAPAYDGTQLCTSTNAGATWSCRRIGGTEGSHPDLAIDASGVMHVAWADANGGGYATSLGSFVAVNWPATAEFEPPSPWPNTMIIGTSVSDRDSDAIQGSIAVGPSVHRRVNVPSSGEFELLGDSIINSGVGMFAADGTLVFRTPGGEWHTGVVREEIASFPIDIAVRSVDGRFVDQFTIEEWEEFAATIDHVEFTPLVSKPFAGTELASLDIRFLPTGPLTLRMRVSDGASFRAFDAPFLRTIGQNTLVLIDFRPAAADLGAALAAIPPSHFKAPGLASVLRFHLDRVVAGVEQALITRLPGARAHWLDQAHQGLDNGILQRTDGCSATGLPDEDDWVVDCADQERLSTAGTRLLGAIDALR